MFGEYEQIIQTEEKLAVALAQRDELLTALKELDAILERAWGNRVLPYNVLTGQEVRAYKLAIAKCEAQGAPSLGIYEEARELKKQRDELLTTMRELACLGNGDNYGNSIGNVIAQKAIAKFEGAPNGRG